MCGLEAVISERSSGKLKAGAGSSPALIEDDCAHKILSF